MKQNDSWEFFFQTGLPEAYLLAKYQQKSQKKLAEISKNSANAVH